MSYFDLPRIYFSGTFCADPSTINNDGANFAEPKKIDPGWNPNGSHAFQLLRGNEKTIRPGATVVPTTVKAVATPAGKVITSGDPLIGTFAASTDDPVFGKLVDLDVDQQFVSQIWGMQVSIGNGADAVVGDYYPAYFQQFFASRFAAAYQSLLTNLKWPKSPKSATLKALKAASPKQLSIRFMLDLLSQDSSDPNFTLGRITGVIGPAYPKEPAHVTIGRMLRLAPKAQVADFGASKEAAVVAANNPEGGPSLPYNFAPAKVDAKRKVVGIDLANALPFDGANPSDAGTLELAVQLPGGPAVLGPIDNSLANYLNQAFFFELPLGEHAKDVASNPLVLLSDGKVVMTENPTGAWIDASEHVYRLDAETNATVTLYATTFGAPAKKGQMIKLGVQQMGNGNTQKPLAVPPSVKLGSGGMATFTMKSGTPGDPRGPIDGQVYGVQFQWSENAIPDQSAFVSVHVYDAFAVPKKPTWAHDILPIFQQYMVLFPYMKNILDLSDKATVLANRKVIAQVMRLPVTDPRFMPVTRSFSGPMTKMILAWLKSPA
jgi:hypothetical protein